MLSLLNTKQLITLTETKDCCIMVLKKLKNPRAKRITGDGDCSSMVWRAVRARIVLSMFFKMMMV